MSHLHRASRNWLGPKRGKSMMKQVWQRVIKNHQRIEKGLLDWPSSIIIVLQPIIMICLHHHWGQRDNRSSKKSGPPGRSSFKEALTSWTRPKKSRWISNLNTKGKLCPVATCPRNQVGTTPSLAWLTLNYNNKGSSNQPIARHFRMCLTSKGNSTEAWGPVEISKPSRDIGKIIVTPQGLIKNFWQVLSLILKPGALWLIESMP